MMIIGIVSINLGFILVHIYLGVKDKLRLRRERQERERKHLEKMSATELPLLKTTHHNICDESSGKNLDNWLDVPVRSPDDDDGSLGITDQL